MFFDKIIQRMGQDSIIGSGSLGLQDGVVSGGNGMMTASTVATASATATRIASICFY